MDAWMHDCTRGMWVRQGKVKNLVKNNNYFSDLKIPGIE
jgi:hypothetical protein